MNWSSNGTLTVDTGEVADRLEVLQKIRALQSQIQPKPDIERACKVAEKLFGKRWDDLEDQDEIVERFMPIADAIREAVIEEREACAKIVEEMGLCEKCAAVAESILTCDPHSRDKVAAAIRARKP